MKRYGFLRPYAAIGRELARTCRLRAGALWSQRRIEVDGNVQIASDVRMRGSGRVIVRAGATIESGVQLVVEDSSTIELGAGVRVGAESRLCARAGQRLELGPGTEVEDHVTIVSVAGVTTGEGSVIGARTAIVCREPVGNGRFALGAGSHLSIDNLVDICSDVLIEDEVRSGPSCAFYTHKHTPSRDQLIWDQPVVMSSIRVGSAVWIGHGCQVMPGVEIGESAVVGAGAVVTKSIQDGEIVGGVPARVL